jgi:hypothetical protein
MSIAQKSPYARTLPLFAKGASLDQIARQGLCLPGHVVSVSGAIVTISFDVNGLTLGQVTMPLASPTYIMLPIQAGDKGVAVPASFYLGGVSGIGGGTANDVQRGNMATLWWEPIGSTSFTTPDPNSVVIRGPNGVILQDISGGTVATLTPTGLTITSASGTLTFTAGGHTVVIDSSGITLDGILFSTHTHLPGTYVADGEPITGISGVVST